MATVYRRHNTRSWTRLFYALMSRVDVDSAAKASRLDLVPVIQRLDETLVNRIAAGEVSKSVRRYYRHFLLNINPTILVRRLLMQVFCRLFTGHHLL